MPIIVQHPEEGHSSFTRTSTYWNPSYQASAAKKKKSSGKSSAAGGGGSSTGSGTGITDSIKNLWTAHKTAIIVAGIGVVVLIFVLPMMRRRKGRRK